MLFAFVVQEETGLNGSKTAAYIADPDAAIVVESTTAADVAGVPEDKQVCHVGSGPVLSFMDRRTIYDRAYYQMAFDAAKETGVSCQAKQAVARRQRRGGHPRLARRRPHGGGLPAVPVSALRCQPHLPEGFP